MARKDRQDRHRKDSQMCHIRFKRAWLAKLDTIVETHGATRSGILRIALREWLERQDKGAAAMS
jgi:hypothetical protein